MSNVDFSFVVFCKRCNIWCLIIYVLVVVTTVFFSLVPAAGICLWAYLSTQEVVCDDMFDQATFNDGLPTTVHLTNE